MNFIKSNTRRRRRRKRAFQLISWDLLRCNSIYDFGGALACGENGSRKHLSRERAVFAFSFSNRSSGTRTPTAPITFSISPLERRIAICCLATVAYRPTTDREWLLLINLHTFTHSLPSRRPYTCTRMSFPFLFVISILLFHAPIRISDADCRLYGRLFVLFPSRRAALFNRARSFCSLFSI